MLVEQQTQSLSTYYEDIYGKPQNEQQAIQNLYEAYHQLMQHSQLTVQIKQGIAEQYRMISYKKLPAYLWMMEAIHQVSKKNPSKQSFPYIVGMLRQWMIHGFGTMPRQEEDEIMNYFLEVTCIPSTSIETKKIINNLLGTYGIVKVTRAISEFSADFDLSKIFAEMLSNNLKIKYSNENAITMVTESYPVNSGDNHSVATIGEIIESKTEVTDAVEENAVEEVAPEKVTLEIYQSPSPKERNSKQYSNQLDSEALIIEQILRSNKGDMKFHELQRVTQNEIKWGNNPYVKMNTLLKHSDNLKKKSYGIYGLISYKGA